jgi:hypothetical protein
VLADRDLDPLALQRLSEQLTVPAGRQAVCRGEHACEVCLIGKARRQRHIDGRLPVPQAVSCEIEPSQERITVGTGAVCRVEVAHELEAGQSGHPLQLTLADYPVLAVQEFLGFSIVFAGTPDDHPAQLRSERALRNFNVAMAALLATSVVLLFK